MAIFGNLTDIPLSDILILGAKGLGRISVTHHESGKVYVLNFIEKDLISFLVDQTPLTDVFSVISAIALLMNAKDADFIIERQLREESTQQFDFLLPVDQLVASVMTVISELESLRCHFPSEKTVFISPSRSEIWLGDELNQFYEQCHTLLARGASGEELAAHTGMSLDRVLLNLHRLRSSSLITPCRAVTSALQTQAGEPRTRLSLFKTPRLRPPAGQVPCISFEQVPPTIVEEPTTGIEKAIQGSFVPAESFYFPPARSEESEPSSSFPTSAHPVSQASRSNVSTDLSQVRIKRPVQGMASKLLGRLARLCRIEVAT